MAGGLGPRFALEATFLILLAAVAAYARLEAVEIIGVMIGGWLIASIFEVLAARRERPYPSAVWERPSKAEEAQPESADQPDRAEQPELAEQPQHEEEPEREEQPQREGRFSWSGRAEDVATPSEEAAAPAQSPPSQQADEATGEIVVPRRRRWFRRSRPAPEVATEAAAPPPRPSARHVRLIRSGTPQQHGAKARDDAEAGP
jgi:hypothetical protein